MTVHRSVSPWALAGLLGGSVAIALFGWYQVRSYGKAQSRFEAFEARIEKDLPAATGIRAVAVTRSPAEADTLVVEFTRVPAAEQAAGHDDWGRIRIGEQSWTLPSKSESPEVDVALAEIEGVLRSALGERGSTKGTVRLVGMAVPTALFLRVRDAFDRAGVTDVIMEGGPAGATVPRVR